MKTKVPFAGRCLLLCVFILGISTSIATRLVELQIIDNKDRGSIAANSLIHKEEIPAQRGIILDSNGELLTNNIQNATVMGNRYHLRSLLAVIDGLAYNQAIHDPRWKDAKDKKAKIRIFKDHHNRLQANASWELTKEEKRKIIEKLGPDAPHDDQQMNYDPEVCKHYFELHDKLVAEVLYRYLSHIQVPVDEEETAQTTKRRKGATEKPKTRPITHQDIIDKIIQPEIRDHNAQARQNGGNMRRYRMEIAIAQNLSFETAEKIRQAIRDARIKGIDVKSGMRRNYVMPRLLSHVLGYVDHENKGRSGVEKSFNDYLNGINGIREYRFNPRGQVLPHEDDRYTPPKHGRNLQLTIDMRIQAIIEEELDRGMRHFRAKNGCMIVVEPKTGDILAMVSRPSFDLNTKEVLTHEGVVPKDSKGRSMLKDAQGNTITGDFNFACQTRYEPGSTFKVIGVTAALDHLKRSIHAQINCSPFSIGNTPRIRDGHDYGMLPMWGVLAKSSNPGAARIALGLSPKQKNSGAIFKKYADLYGLTRSANIELPSGGGCSMQSLDMPINLSRVAYGYSVSVSPLHMAMVYATIANDGVRMKPRLVKKIIASDGKVLREIEPQVAATVMRPKVAKDLRFALETVTRGAKENGPVVRRGTATRAAIPGFRIGGKTGTAKKIKPQGGYYDHLYTVSFAAVLPVDDPKMVIMTVIDEPHPTDCEPGGGTVAAPIFRAAAERIIQTLNLIPSDQEAYDKAQEEKNAETAAPEA